MRPLKGFLAAVALLVGASSVDVAHAAGEAVHIERQTWSFGGFTGQYDPAQLQRGFQVYKDVCAACHGLKRVRFRNLFEPGGPEFPEESVKALANEWPNKIIDGPNDEGQMFEREPKAFDPVLGPFKNDNEARAAQNGALPVDLSLIAKARNVEYHGSWWAHPFSMLRDIATSYQEGGADYLYALLTGYHEAPAGVQMADGMNYNAAFPGHQIAMPAPLSKDAFVTYQDGTGSLEQNARDVSAFLTWAADPTLNTRKSTGWIVIFYLLATTALLYFGKRRLWSKIPH
ncbi:cytochrome c1 [Hyphomicrobium sp. CS1GBMeth3]|uniref:cytochrome c1 n=1 Tax=Hyphomicrobium sp. CS1GBMeth3 TaxID=1892845 RepID=UPI000931C01C|nr:cytochrome c1 [Hyphomicrobium sp. CS1GBMeth3]